MSLAISIREKRDVSILDLSGDLLAGDCGGLHGQVKELVAAGKSKFALNFKEVGAIDNAGLGVLAAAFVSIQRVDGRLGVYGTNQQVRDALERIRLDQVIEVHPWEWRLLASF